MAQKMLVLSSITYAYKAQKILEKNWIPSSVIRTPDGLVEKGCSYSLAVRGDLSRAAHLLSQSGIQILKTVE